MTEVIEPVVLRYREGDPEPPCPVCALPVSGMNSETETVWTLKPEYQGMVGLPVGPEFGEQHAVGVTLRVQPCGHQIDRYEVTAKEPASPPFSGDDATCQKCGQVGASTSYIQHGRCLHDGSHVTLGWDRNERLHRECRRCGYEWDEATVEKP